LHLTTKRCTSNPTTRVAWFNRGVALYDLGQFEQAITSFDQALHIKPDYHEAWYNRGVAAGNSVSCDLYLASQSPIAQQNPALNQRGYEGALASYEQGLKYCLQDTHPEGWGILHQAIGNAHYFRGRRDSSPRPYWRKAVNSYYKALKTLTAAAFPEAHLEVLQDLIRVYSDLGETQKVEVLLGEGTDLLGRLLQETPSDAEKIRLSRKFAGFDQLRVDALVQAGNCYAALELAEQRKNLYLGWLLYGWSESAQDSPKYAQMQELLQSSATGKDGEKAIIYWHISPTAITTFILRYQQPPLVLSAKADLTPPAPLPYKGMGESDSPLKSRRGAGGEVLLSPISPPTGRV
jgi:tetratricopeptide (TPR) repeat protein